MLHYGFRSCVILIRKIKPTVVSSYSFNTSITPLSASNFQTILRTKFLKRDFYINANNYNVANPRSKEEQDAIDNEKLQKLLEDSNKEKAFKLLQYELEYMKHLTEEVPQNLRPKDWIYLLNATSKSQQRKYIRFLFINEMRNINAKKKKKIETEENLKQWEEIQESFTSGLTYGLNYNSLFLRIYDKTIDTFSNYNLILSMLFEPKIIFDCGYEDHMAPFEIKNCARQLLLSFVLNRTHQTPAHLYLCNAPKDGQIMKKLHNLIPNIYEDYFPLDHTSRSYLDMFDKEKLVYLTPHCRTPMESYDPDKIYIIGAIVDKTDPKPYSLAKAKREGIRMEKLPIEQYLYWSTGSRKSLTLNQVLSILLDLKYTKDWVSALQKNIPTRKQVQDLKSLNSKLC